MDNSKKTDQASYDAIAKMIHSDTSPVGIDAKKTHILILQKLEEISQRLERLEKKLEAE
jgi:hypothetical protein